MEKTNGSYFNCLFRVLKQHLNKQIYFLFFIPVRAKKTEWPKETLTSAVSPDVYPEDFTMTKATDFGGFEHCWKYLHSEGAQLKNSSTNAYPFWDILMRKCRLLYLQVAVKTSQGTCSNCFPTPHNTIQLSIFRQLQKCSERTWGVVQKYSGRFKVRHAARPWRMQRCFLALRNVASQR